MVYIYKKTVGGKLYYYLRVSERKGKRVIAKDIAYLGNTIEEVKKNINKLPDYKDEIRKAYKTLNSFLESNYYLEKIKYSKLKKDEFLKNFLIEFAFNTTSIEGNTINLAEAKNLLQEGLTPKDKTLREIYDLQNTEKVFFEIISSKEELNHEFIIKIHDKLIENIDPRKGYRTVDVRVIRSNFEATPAPYVKADMILLIKWYNENKNKLHPLVLATIFHHKFEKIHPFMDGNGRTGRMLLNYILITKNYPPLIIHKSARKDFLEVMRKADKSELKSFDVKDYFELVQFSAYELIDSYWGIFL